MYKNICHEKSIIENIQITNIQIMNFKYNKLHYTCPNNEPRIYDQIMNTLCIQIIDL